jgi:hypothetical protein
MSATSRCSGATGKPSLTYALSNGWCGHIIGNLAGMYLAEQTFPRGALNHVFVLIYDAMIDLALGKVISARRYEIAEWRDFDFAQFSVAINTEVSPDGKNMVIVITYSYAERSVSCSSSKPIDLSALTDRFRQCCKSPAELRTTAMHCYVDLIGWLNLDNGEDILRFPGDLEVPVDQINVSVDTVIYNARTELAVIADIFSGLSGRLMD